MTGTAGSRRLVQAFAVGVLCIACPTAHAHRPHSQLVGHTTAAGGDVLTVRRYMVDGIFFADPVRLDLVGPSGQVVTSTPFSRETCTLRVGSDLRVVFRFESLMLPAPAETWLLRAGKLERADSWLLWPLAVVAQLVEHALGYAATTAFLVVLWIGLASRKGPGFIATVTLSVLVLPIWAWCVAAYSYMSLTLCVILATGVCLSIRRWRRRRHAQRVEEESS